MDNTNCHQMEQELRRQIELMALLSQLATNFIGFDANEIDDGINEALMMIGTFTGADRSYVFLFSDNGANMDNTHEWCSEGVLSQIEGLKDLETALFPWLIVKLNRLEHILIPRVTDLTQEAKIEKEHFTAQDIKSLVVVPIASKEKLMGFLGFDSIHPKKTWSEDIVALMRIIGSIIGDALKRKIAEEKVWLAYAELEQIFQTAANGMRVVDINCNVIRMNKAMEKCTGVSQNEAKDKKCYETFSSSYCHTPECPLDRIIHGEKLVEHEVEKVCLDGKKVSCILTATPFRDTNGKLLGIVEDFQDITERKQAEEILYQEKEGLSVTLQSIGDAVIAVDPEQKVTLLNTVAENLTGWTLLEALGKPMDQVFHIINEHTRKPANNPVNKVLAENRIVELDNHTLLISRDGIERPIEDTAAPIRDKSGKISGVVLVFRDVTKEKTRKDALIKSEARFRNISENAWDIIYRATVYPELDIEYINPAVVSIINFDPWEFYENHHLIFDIVHPEDREVLTELLTGKSEPFNPFQLRLISKQGNIVWTEHRTVPIFNDSGNLIAIEGIARDISERKKAEEELKNAHQQLQDIIEFLPDATFVINQNKQVIAWNRAMEDLTGTPKEKMIGRGEYAYAVPIYGNPRPILIDLMGSDEELSKYKYRNVKRQGNTTYAEALASALNAVLWSIATPLYDSNENVVGAIQSIRDITSRKRMEEQLEYLGLHDPLTGMYNRAFFEKEMSRLENQGVDAVGMIVCDLDGLKLVNDTLGHNAGDTLLRNAAKVMSECFRKSDVAARIGGDEFAILIPNSDETAVKGTCDRLREMYLTHNRENRELPIYMSIGYAFSKKPLSLRDLFKEADNNMYRDKLHHSKSSRSAIVETLLKALKARDLITEGHGDRLQIFVTSLAQAINLSEQKINDLRLLAQFHDIGKVGIPDRILLKQGPLTLEEIEEMKRHSEIGCRIAQSSPDLIPIADWILKHHEWWNGKGYPLGLKKEEIPIECRIVAIADAYDAMTNDRPYRKAISPESAFIELRKHAGQQFDPILVKEFIQLIKTKFHENARLLTGRARVPRGCVKGDR